MVRKLLVVASTAGLISTGLSVAQAAPAHAGPICAFVTVTNGGSTVYSGGGCPIENTPFPTGPSQVSQKVDGVTMTAVIVA